jgi:hypothetical protein
MSRTLGDVMGLQAELNEAIAHKKALYEHNDRLRLKVDALEKKLEERLEVLTETSVMCGEALGERDWAVERAKTWKRVARRLFIRVQRRIAQRDQARRYELEFRRLLWQRHGCAGLYGDDGEMQCGSCILDFKRQPPSEIELRWIMKGRV